MILHKGAIFLILLFTASSAFSYQESRELNIAAQGITALSIDCGAGFLKVIGEKNRQNIRVTADIRSQNLSVAAAKRIVRKNLELNLHQRGTRAVLTSQVSSFRRGGLEVNLTVYVPNRLSLKIDDGSGEMTVRNISGSVFIDDGSGGMDLQNLGGTVEINDGSGDLSLTRSEGDVRISDGSGEILVSRINGNLTVDDHSGSIRIAGVAGNVRIRDRSGGIHIREVGRDVHIVEDGSGSLTITHVKGNIYNGSRQTGRQREARGTYVF